MPSKLRIVTLAERRAAALERRMRRQRALERRLAHAAVRHGGAYRVFGSAGRGDLQPESDVDLLADFPPERVRAAIAAEDACEALGLRHDVLDQAACDPEFLRHVLGEARVIA